MSSMRGGAGSYQYPQGSRPNNQPMNYGNNPTNQDYSTPQSLYVERRSTNPVSTAPVNRPQNPPNTQSYAIPQSLYVERRSTNPVAPVNRPQQYTSNTQDYSIPQSFYVERRSTNPVPVTQPNQPQYIEPKNSTVGYQNARAVQAQTAGMYHQKNPGTPSRNVNPALIKNPSPYSQSPYATQGRESGYAKKETLGEIDDSPIIDPSAFRYLNLDDKKAPNKKSSAANESGIDSRPIINLDAVTQLEKRRQQQIEKSNRIRGDDGSGPGIDGRSMVDANAFRHIEAKTKKGQNNDEGGIDARPITNPDAFKYLEGRREPKPSKNANEVAIDTRPIINPDAFKYLEKRRDNLSRDNDESGIDYKPMVNPDAFRYLEQRGPPPRRDIESGIDTKSIVDPNAFQHIERKGIPKPEITESSIDYRPMVNPKAFKYIEAKEPKRVIEGPDVDERSYINPQSFQNVDRRFGKKSDDICKSEIDTRSFILDRNPNALAHLERQSSYPTNDKQEGGIDERSYVNPNSFKYLEGISDDTPQSSAHSSAGPPIDTKSYVNADSFRHLEGRQRTEKNDQTAGEHRGIDETSFVPPAAFRHLEFTGERTNPEQTNYSAYEHSDL